MTPNPYELSARFRKATALHALLKRHGLTTLVRIMQPEHWQMLAQAAGVKPPSQKTVRVVVELCEEW